MQKEHKMHGAEDQFKDEVAKQEKLVKESSEIGLVDEVAAGRLGGLRAIEKSDTDPKDPAERASMILSDNIRKYSTTKDDDGKVYFWIERKDRSYDAFAHDDEKLVRFVLREYDRKYGKPLSRHAGLQAIHTHTAKGDVPGNAVKHVGKRMVKTEDAIWLDLRDEANSIYRITDKYLGPPYPYTPDIGVLFNRDGGAEMPCPEKKEGDWLEWLCVLLRIPQDMKALFKVHVVHLFWMWQETPFMLLTGSYGTGKTLTAAMIKELVDPAGIDNAPTTLPKDGDSTARLLTKEQAILFDNVSYISPEVSDILCQACTGGAHKTRELYTTNNMITTPFSKMRILITSISSDVARSPDLASRTLTYKLPIMKKDESRNDLLKEYEANRPYLLYHIMDVMRNALAEYENNKERYDAIKTTTRMVDFERFGSVIGAVLGDKNGDSMTQYQGMMSDAMSLMVAEHPVVILIEKLLEDEGGKEYYHTLRELYARLIQLAANEDAINTRAKSFPNSSRSLGIQLEKLAKPLLERGIMMVKHADHTAEAPNRQLVHVRLTYTDEHAKDSNPA